MRRKKEVTMQHVADHMNISKVTVSKALNDKEGVSEELKNKIKDIAGQLGYKIPGNKASTHVYKNITILIQEELVNTEEYTTFYLRTYQKVASALNKEGYICNLLTLNYQKEEQTTVLERISTNQTVIIITMGQIDKHFMKEVNNLNIPVICLGYHDTENTVDCILTDNYYSAYELTNELIKNGHTVVGFVGKINATSTIQDRFLGYCRSLIERRIEINYPIIVPDRDELGNKIELILPQTMPTAFVCSCDDTAFRLVDKLKKSGYKVPEDCSVVGFNNDFHAQICEPKLTTVAVNIDMIAQKVVMLVRKNLQFEDTDTKVKVFVLGEIIHRESVKKIAN